uniref:RING-type domain-containing protein n=1 Tax=Vannella robusta TaxID=1487602 RepID=A0A7S4MS13_9EUKA|mmetsp:Transcript_8492/g.10481  ORF Transcript_8492/g.10481 Transcript_8492/m.10481 type:complete len:273 (+) Transcript_8492:20-838(+)
MNWMHSGLFSMFRRAHSSNGQSSIIFVHGEPDDDNDSTSIRISIVFVPGMLNMPPNLQGLEDILDQSLRQARSRRNPISPSAFDALPTFTLKAVTRFPDPCSICQENFEEGEVVTKLPCGHTHHKDCISGWFNEHNSCPVCRYELPVEDPDNERERKARMSERDAEIARKPKCCELLDFTECLHEGSSDKKLKALSSCGHFFHPECVETWAKKDGQSCDTTLACPICHSLSALPSSIPEPTTVIRPPHKKRKRRELGPDEDVPPLKRVKDSI